MIQRLEEMIEKPKLIIDLLSKTLPSQSTYFIQISVVSTIVNGGMELLRVVPVGMAIMRSFIAPSLTEKERRATYFGLQSLCNPFDFQHPDFTSQVVRCCWCSTVVLQTPPHNFWFGCRCSTSWCFLCTTSSLH